MMVWLKAAPIYRTGTTNQTGRRTLLETENAWPLCAAQVDMIIDCQERIDAQSAAHP